MSADINIWKNLFSVLLIILIPVVLFILQYDSAYKKWEVFCSKSGIPSLPADPVHVAACLSLTMMDTESISTVNLLRAAIANRHHVACLPNPTEHLRVSNLFKAFHRIYGEPRAPVDSLTYEIICQMISHLRQPKHGRDAMLASLVLWRTVWRTVINFFSLGRFSDLDKVERSSISFIEQPSLHMKIVFIGVKNDIFNEGGEKVLSANLSEPQFCPVLLTQHYLQFLGSSYSGSMLPNCDPKNIRVALPGSKLLYSNGLKDLRSLLMTLGYGHLRIGEHSAKRGGASHAANLGVSKDDLQRLGGWRSSDVPSRYVDLSLNKRIALSRSLMKNL